MPSTSEYSPNAQNLVASALAILVQNIQSYPQADADSCIHDREDVGSLYDTYVAPDARIQEAVSTRNTIILLAHLFLLYSDMEPEHRHSQQPS